MKHETIAKYKLHRHLERNQQPRQPIQSVVKVADSPPPMQLPFTRHLFWKIFENWVTQSRGCKPKPSEFPASARQFLDALGKASKRFFHALYCHGFCARRTQRVFVTSQIRNPLLMQLFQFFDL